jgi:hypothetical protein
MARHVELGMVPKILNTSDLYHVMFPITHCYIVGCITTVYPLLITPTLKVNTFMKTEVSDGTNIY